MNKIPHHTVRKPIHHTISQYPLYIPSMYIVSILMIKTFLRNNKKEIGEKNVVTLYSKYTVHML